MRIEWHKVTWYSKTIALALFVALPFVGFYFGIEIGQGMGILQAFSSMPEISTASPAPSAGAAYYKNIAEWQTDRDDVGGFSIAYPIDFQTDENYTSAPSTDWRLDANNAPGVKAFTLTIPKAFEPQTNFADATLTVGRSKNAVAVADCLTADRSGGPGATSATATINGIQFSVFNFNGVGAGNYYETTSYRTMHAGECYAVEYTIHSAQIANYPAEYNLKPFDKAKLTDLLDRIAGTFTFL
ncbi:MAG TPA: hypothetical protein VNG29_00285 [Candidatus Paceibacterota bacterium]|nr:hypothetical protein [Candidatus Paceibacterota bacterium]